MSEKIKYPALFCVLFLLLFAAFASAEETDKEKSERIMNSVREISRTSLVQLDFFFRDPRGNVSPAMLQHDLVVTWQTYWTSEKPFRSWGVLYGTNKILTTNLDALPEIIKSISVTFFDGTTANARLEEVVVNAEAWILGLDKAHEKSGPLFDAPYTPKFGDELLAAKMKRLPGGVFQIDYGSTNWAMESSSNSYSDSILYDALLFNEEGVPVSYSVSNTLYCNKGKTNWLANEYLNGPRMTVEKFRERMAAIQENIGNEILPVRLEIRGKRAGTDDPVVFGIPLDGNGSILIPSQFNADTIKNIKTFNVMWQGTEQPAQFVGQLRNFSAMLIRMPQITGAASIIAKDAEIGLNELTFALAPFSIAGKSDSVPYPFRLNAFASYWDGNEFMVDGTLQHTYEYLFDQQGKCVGVYLHQFREWNNGDFLSNRYDRYSRYRFNMPGDAWSGGQFMPVVMRPVSFAELMDIAAAPSKHIVPGVAPMSVQEAKKSVWLGVEMQPISRNIAEYLNIMEPTKYGTIGVRITWVYPNSPAHFAGFRVGDILLVIKKLNSTSQFELDGDSAEPASWWNRYPWPDRKTALVERLSQFGLGSEIEIQFLRGTDKQSIKMKLEASPEDFNASPAYKGFELGYRCKNLTYEVRRFFNIPADKTGIIVYRIESGSKAQVAELYRYDIIMKVNNVSAGDVKTCEKLMTAALDDDNLTINLEILRLGETRFIEIKKPSKEEIAKIRAEHPAGSEEEDEGEEPGMDE